MTIKAELIESYNAVISGAEALASIARATELQEKALVSLEQLSSEITSEKTKAIEAENEGYANILLGYECAVDVVMAELKMWILLKRGEPNLAWDQLIRAQDAALAAVRADSGFAHASIIYERLEVIEHLVFPPQVFLSSGFIVGRQICSICGEEYGECRHLKGKPYMGQFCQIVLRELTADHIAIVKHPRDKRCRVMSFSVEGGNRDRMTWQISSSDKLVSSDGLQAIGRFV